MGRFEILVYPLLLVLLQSLVPGLDAAVRRAQRDRGLLEMYKPKTPWPRCISHESHRIPGNRVRGVVSLDGRILFEMIMPAGGFRVDQRAEIVARRLERLLEMKSALEEVKVENWDGQWVVSLGGSLVLTAATGESRYFAMSRRELARRWADSLRTTLHNALGPGAQVLRGDPPVEKIRVSEPPWDDRYKAILKGDRAFDKGYFEKAAAFYRRGIIEDRSAFDSRYKLAKALEKLGRLKEAKRQARACLQLRPEYQAARALLYRIDGNLHSK